MREGWTTSSQHLSKETVCPSVDSEMQYTRYIRYRVDVYMIFHILFQCETIDYKQHLIMTLQLLS